MANWFIVDESIYCGYILRKCLPLTRTETKLMSLVCAGQTEWRG